MATGKRPSTYSVRPFMLVPLTNGPARRLCGNAVAKRVTAGSHRPDGGGRAALGGDPELLVRLGEMNLARGDLDAAEMRAEAAIKNQRQLASAWALRGDVQKERGRMDEALLSYHRALAYQEQYPRVQIAIAEVYRYQDRPQRALSTLDHLFDRYAPGTVPSEVELLCAVWAQKRSKRKTTTPWKAWLSWATKNGRPTAEILFQS